MAGQECPQCTAFTYDKYCSGQYKTKVKINHPFWDGEVFYDCYGFDFYFYDEWVCSTCEYSYQPSNGHLEYHNQHLYYPYSCNYGFQQVCSMSTY